MLLQSGQPAATIDDLPNELLLDILARLPGKQIGICKCVSKPWRSTIRSRPFRDTYRKKNSGLLLLSHSSRDDRRRHLRFFHCPLRRHDDPPADFSPLTQLDLVEERNGRLVTEMVDGMLCSYTHDRFADRSSISGPTLHNICTGEKMRIPDPVNYADTCSMYNIGYDGISKVYKLLRLIFKRPYGTLWGTHIMTLRPSSGPPSTWRELAECGLPSDLNCLSRTKACSDDGLMCWLIGNESMAWFDLSIERFRYVELPQDVKSRKKRAIRAVTRLKDSLALWVSSCYSEVNVSCYVQEDEEGKTWRISKEIVMSERFGFGFAAGIFPSSIKGEMLRMELDGTGRVLSYGRQQANSEEEDVLFVGNLPGGNAVFVARSSKIVCLADANNLYMPLDDVLGGGVA